jgi:hypothetical protein
MNVTETPGAQTPYLAINQLLTADERFEVVYPQWRGYLFAPKNRARLSALVYLLQESQLSFRIQGKGLHVDLNSPSSIILSTRALTQMRLNEDVLEVEAGCDLRTVQSYLFEFKREIHLDDWIWSDGRGTVGSAVVRGCQTGVVFRHAMPKPLLQIDCLRQDGGSIRLGRALPGASAGPALHQLLWGSGFVPALLSKFYFQTYPVPPIRLHVAWPFSAHQKLLEHLESLKSFSQSWEQLDCLFSGQAGEKSFLLARISGLPEEMEYFKQECPSFKEAILEPLQAKFKSFFLSKQMSYFPIGLEAGLDALQCGDYLWHHSLTDGCWLISLNEMASFTAEETVWKKRLDRVLRREKNG